MTLFRSTKTRASVSGVTVAVRVKTDDTRWTTWEELLRRVFGVDSLACPHCGQQMTLRTVVVRPPASIKVLVGLTRAARGPP
jgi:hypothetical protein